MSTNAISKAIGDRAGDSTKASKEKSTLERQVDAAEFYGVLPSVSEDAPKKRGPGRPPKSKSPGPRPVTSNEPKPTSSNKAGIKKPTDEAVDAAVDEMRRNKLITKVRAYAAYWPELCGNALRELNIYLCSTEQLERIIQGFEETVNMDSEIVEVPRTVKNILGKLEPIAIGLALNNPDHRFLREGVKLQGLSHALISDPAVDKNIKLISVKYLIGRMPKNPLLNLLWSIVMVGIDVYKNNCIQQIAEQHLQEDKYEEL
jgi:hypothetical protein